ncbi:PAS domain S-box protein [Opitutus terrae]|uniref:histidine kinase n=1 Tax=Opitutus terrae (strain DSM 11246 / JCM 15787 / PB90-1) TaxID=452637 RepID=B1ZZE8_OPITP|nr:PAS domain S-box protein [Opitutus terrae]ACB76351.1 multi-sensor hybrid histidine kinase [Opitutus terrae PB90-1]
MAQPDSSGAWDQASPRDRIGVFVGRIARHWNSHYVWAAGACWTGLIVVALVALHDGGIAEVALDEFAVFLGLWGAGVLALIGGHRVAQASVRERMRMVAALRTSEASYRELFENSPNPMLVYDVATLQFLAVNDAAQRQYGYAREDFLRLTVGDIHPAAEMQQLESTLRTERPPLAFSGPWTHLRHDGSCLRVEVSSHALSWDGRAARCVVVTDISEQQRLNATVEEQAVTYQTLLSAALDGVVETDESGRLIAANEAFLMATGYSMPELATRTIADLEANESPEDVQRHLAQVRLAGRVRFETRLRAHDGRLIDFEVNVVHVPGRGRFVSILRDITQRNRAEQVLRLSEERFREAIEHAGAGYFRIDRAARFEAVNSAWLAMHGFTRAEEVLGQDYLTTQAQEDADAAADVVRRALAGEAIAAGEFRRRRADGSTGYHTFSLHPVRRGREIVAIEGFLIDTTPLKQAMADYKMLFDTMLDGFALHEIVRDEQGRAVDLRYTAVNPAFERQTGIRAADVVGRRMSEAIPGMEPEWMEAYRLVAETGEPRVFERYSQPLNRHFTVSAFRPSVGQLVCVFVDITARKLAEIELRKLSRAVEQSPVSVIITETSGEIEYVNPWFTETTGYSLEEVRGKNPRVLSSGETSGETYREMWQAITSGREWRGEFHNRRKDGTLFWEAATIGPIFDDEGKISRFLAVKEDITERKRASERIREQAALLDVAHDGILVTTMDRVVTYWNRAAERMYGIPATEALGHTLDELIPGENSEVRREEWQRLIERGEWSGERQHVVRSGGTIDVRVHATLVRNAAGQPTSVLIVVTDVTASKRMEKQFLRAQRIESLGALASGVAHDLNNVLTPILMSVELLRPLAQNQADRDMLQLLSDSARRGSDIVQQLLLFGRGSESPRVPLNVAGILKDTGRLMRETFPKKIVQTVYAPADLRLVEADRTQIHQVVLNLCVNARDAMPEGGRLQITAENVEVEEELAQRHAAKGAGRYVRITVRDTGAGISPENLDKIFDPFFTTKPVGQGTGLGLATVLGIVRGHGGFVDVKSQLGRGAAFEVYLPAVAMAVEPLGVEPAAAALHGRGEAVLVIEDEEAIRSMLQRALTQHNYRVLTASDGAEALGVYAQNAGSIDLVITDAMMPVMDGAQTARALRGRDRSLPIIAISGLPAQRAELEKIPGPRIHFLPKPFATDHALHLVREALDVPAQGAALGPATK